MATESKKLTEIKKGSFVMINGVPCRVMSIATSRPGKHGHAKSRIVGIGVFDDQKRELLATHEVTVPVIERKAGQVLAGGGVAAIGYGPPAALAAHIIHPDRRVICVCGDGGLMMHLYALEMARDLGLPVTFVVLNNSCLGNVRDFLAADRRMATEYSQPGFAKMARGFSLDSVRIEKPGELGSALKKAVDSREAWLVEVIVDDLPHFKLISR